MTKKAVVVRSNLDISDFKKRLKDLSELQRKALSAMQAAAGTLLSFAANYYDLYKEVRRDQALVKELNETLNLSDRQATRLRKLGHGAGAKHLRKYQKSLPPSLENLYETSLKDEADIVKAIQRGKLTPDTTLREVRAIGKKKPRVAQPLTTTSPDEQHEYKVTLSSTNREELFDALIHTLTATAYVNVNCRKNEALYADVRERMNKHDDGNWWRVNEEKKRVVLE